MNRVPSMLRMPVLRMLLAVLLFPLGAAFGQDSVSGLSGAESRMLSALMDRFQPLPSVGRIWTGAFVAASEKSARLKARVDSLERSGLDESEVLVRVGALRTEIRAVREDRNAFVSGFLSPVDQLALDSIVNPPAPSIQHFGFHDRMKCLVCKVPGAMDVPPGIPPPSLKQ